jgi:nicotinamide mononucleotide adenylyltransferase
MKSFQQFFIEQQENKTAAFTYGRFNPVTVGHEKLVNKLKQVAGGNDVFIIPSHTTNTEGKHTLSQWKNPLTFEEKKPIIEQAFGIPVLDSGKTIYDALKDLERRGYTQIIQVAGDDRTAEFEHIRNKDMGRVNPKSENEDTFFNFKQYDVVSSGARDPDSEGIEGVSASKVREAALNGDYEYVKNAIPSSVSEDNKKLIYDVIRNRAHKKQVVK